MARFLISAFADEASNQLAGQIAALKRNGLRCIEPRNIEGPILKKSDAELTEIANTLRENGISVPSLGSPIGKYSIDDDFDVHLADFRRALRACEILGAKNMRIFSFFVPQDRLTECRDEVLRRMNVLLGLAEEAGITLCHENESRIYGQNPAEVSDLLTNLPRLRGIFDAANYIREGQDPMEGIRVTLPSLKYLHIKDARFSDGAILPCGMGDGRYDEVISRVNELTDDVVFLTLEPHLYDFVAFKQIDAHQLATGLSFATADEAFDCAAIKLKELLTSMGYREGEDQLWKK